MTGPGIDVEDEIRVREWWEDVSPRRGEILVDEANPDRHAVFTGEEKTSYPPFYCVVWCEDASSGLIHAPRCQRLTPDEPEHVREERWRRFCR